MYIKYSITVFSPKYQAWSASHSKSIEDYLNNKIKNWQALIKAKLMKPTIIMIIIIANMYWTVTICRHYAKHTVWIIFNPHNSMMKSMILQMRKQFGKIKSNTQDRTTVKWF